MLTLRFYGFYECTYKKILDCEAGMIKATFEELGSAMKAFSALIFTPAKALLESDGKIICCGLDAYRYYLYSLMFQLVVQTVMSSTSSYWSWQPIVISLLYSIIRIFILSGIWYIVSFIVVREFKVYSVEMCLFHTGTFSIFTTLYLAYTALINKISFEAILSGAKVNIDIGFLIIIAIISYIYLFVYMRKLSCGENRIIIFVIASNISYGAIRPYVVVPLGEVTRSLLLTQGWGGV